VLISGLEVDGEMTKHKRFTFPNSLIKKTMKTTVSKTRLLFLILFLVLIVFQFHIISDSLAPEANTVNIVFFQEEDASPVDQESSTSLQVSIPDPASRNTERFYRTDNMLAHRWKSHHREDISSRMDLPRIFLHPFTRKEDVKSKLPICVFTRTPRQDSLFRSGVLARFGSNKYYYKILRGTDCQHNGTCPTQTMAQKHPGCDATTMPTIYLFERIKNFGHWRFDQAMENGIDFYDVFMATGDEFCRTHYITHNRVHFRPYYGPLVTNTSLSSPIYLPLGPREEFSRVLPEQVKLIKERGLVFNFLGSLTSPSRQRLGVLINTSLKRFPSFTHVIKKWGKKLTASYGYLPPTKYRETLLNSIFTLCPAGHNPEAYRIYEACEAGSIPILVLDDEYDGHECKQAFTPLLQQGAPFIFLNNWDELPAFLDSVNTDTARLQRLQADVMGWYGKFMSKVALQFEKVVELRFKDRIGNGKYTTNSELRALKSNIHDPNYEKPLI